MPSLPAARVTSISELSTTAGCSSPTVALGLEADRVDAAVDLGHAEDLLDLVGDRRVGGDVDRLAAERARLLQPLRVRVADDHHRGAEQLRGVRGGQPDRAGAGDVDASSRCRPRP